jgi:quercetin dioxygenase-like cupin family protein
MVELLQVSHTRGIKPEHAFLKIEEAQGNNPEEAAEETSLFDFASTNYEMGARVIFIPPNRFFAEHTHPYAHHFIFVLKGTGVMIYDGQRYILKEGDTCLVRKGVIHKLGAAEDGLQAICVNTPTYAHDDPNHVHYTEEETLESVMIGYGDAHDHHGHEHHHEHEHVHHHGHEHHHV